MMLTEIETPQPKITKKSGSRYNINVPLTGGRRLVFNSMTMAMAVWEAEDVAAYDKILAGEEVGTRGFAIS